MRSRCSAPPSSSAAVERAAASRSRSTVRRPLARANAKAARSTTSYADTHPASNARRGTPPTEALRASARFRVPLGDCPDPRPIHACRVGDDASADAPCPRVSFVESQWLAGPRRSWRRRSRPRRSQRRCGLRGGPETASGEGGAAANTAGVTPDFSVGRPRAVTRRAPVDSTTSALPSARRPPILP